MSYDLMRIIICDGCGKERRFSNLHWCKLDLELIKSGWKRGYTKHGRNAIHLCEVCNKQQPPDWWDEEIYKEEEEYD